MSNQLTFIIAFGMTIGMKIVCFVLGYFTIFLGYKLIKSGVTGEFKFSAQLKGAKADLASVSPGLLFVFLGVLLIGYAIYVEKSVRVEGWKVPCEQKENIPIPPKTTLPFP